MKSMITAAAVALANCYSAISAEAVSRQAILDWFETNQFGVRPAAAATPSVAFGEKSITVTEGGKSVTISLEVVVPEGASAEQKVPVFVFGDHSMVGDVNGGVYPNVPAEEIVRRGYAFVRYYFRNVAPNADQGAAASAWAKGVFELYGGADRTDSSWGTISAWAWGFSRVMDWISQRPELDAAHVAVAGHSRGGKAALWAGATDARIAMACSSCSGCGGAQQLRLKVAGSEKIADITAPTSYSFWFARNWTQWANREEDLPYDGADLIGLMAGRLAYVSSGSTDVWAGPSAETAAVNAARDAGATVGRHIHDGGHALTREDWEYYVAFADEQWGVPALSRLKEPDLSEPKTVTGGRYFAELTVADYAGSAPLADFPVLVRLSRQLIRGFEYGHCRADGSDVFFTSVDGATTYAHEIEKWDAAGTSFIWVKLPQLTANAKFRMIYGGEAKVSTATAVWQRANGGFAGVWHMNEASGSVSDATGHELTAVPYRTATTAGCSDSIAVAGAVGNGRQIGRSVGVSGTGGPRLVVANSPHLDVGSTFTASAWVRNAGGGNSFPRIFSRKPSGTDATGWEIHGSSTYDVDGKMLTVQRASGKWCHRWYLDYPLNEWVYVTFVYNGTELTAYCNGKLMSSGAACTDPSSAVVDNDLSLSIGAGQASEWSLVGSMDEARILDDVASGDWAAADYATQSSPSFLVSTRAYVNGGGEPTYETYRLRSGDSEAAGSSLVVGGHADNWANLTNESDILVGPTIAHASYLVDATVGDDPTTGSSWKWSVRAPQLATDDDFRFGGETLVLKGGAKTLDLSSIQAGPTLFLKGTKAGRVILNRLELENATVGQNVADDSVKCVEADYVIGSGFSGYFNIDVNGTVSRDMRMLEVAGSFSGDGGVFFVSPYYRETNYGRLALLADFSAFTGPMTFAKLNDAGNGVGTFITRSGFVPAGDIAALDEDSVRLTGGTYVLGTSSDSTATNRGITVSAGVTVSVADGAAVRFANPLYGSGDITRVAPEGYANSTLELAADAGGWTGVFAPKGGTTVLSGDRPLGEGTLDATAAQASVIVEVNALGEDGLYLANAAKGSRLSFRWTGECDLARARRLVRFPAASGITENDLQLSIVSTPEVEGCTIALSLKEEGSFVCVLAEEESAPTAAEINPDPAFSADGADLRATVDVVKFGGGDGVYLLLMLKTGDGDPIQVVSQQISSAGAYALDYSARAGIVFDTASYTATVVISNAYGGTVWTSASNPSDPFVFRDTATYTWKSEVSDGAWESSANWTSDKGADCTGFPAGERAKAVFPAGVRRVAIGENRTVDVDSLTIPDGAVLAIAGVDTNSVLRFASPFVVASGSDVTFSNLTVQTEYAGSGAAYTVLDKTHDVKPTALRFVGAVVNWPGLCQDGVLGSWPNYTGGGGVYLVGNASTVEFRNSDVLFGYRIGIGGDNSKIVVDNCRMDIHGFCFGAHSASFAEKGVNQRLEISGRDTCIRFASIGTIDSPTDFDVLFRVPTGGFARCPLDASGKAWMRIGDLVDRDHVAAGRGTMHFVVDPASPVFASSGKINQPLVLAPDGKGFWKERVVVDPVLRPSGIPRDKAMFAYGDGTAGHSTDGAYLTYTAGGFAVIVF